MRAMVTINASRKMRVLEDGSVRMRHSRVSLRSRRRSFRQLPEMPRESSSSSSSDTAAEVELPVSTFSPLKSLESILLWPYLLALRVVHLFYGIYQECIRLLFTSVSTIAPSESVEIARGFAIQLEKDADVLHITALQTSS